MPRPDQTPRLPKLPFLIADAALLAAAAFIAANSTRPLATTPLIAVVSCVALAAVLGAIPFLTDYARRQDEALDERQRALEALGATVTASAEQIGIAANGIHEIAELVQKNLRAADQLPHKLHEKIGEFTSQLTNARADETEELEKSLAELRAAESERLATVAEKIAKAVSDLAKLEAASQKQLSAANEALAQLTASSSRHFSDLSSATTAAITRAQSTATAAVDAKLAAADLAFTATRTALLADLDAKLTAFRAALTENSPRIETSIAAFSPSLPAPSPETPSPAPLSPAPAASSPAVEAPDTNPAPATPESAPVPRKRAPKKPAPSATEIDLLSLSDPTLPLLNSAPTPAAETTASSTPAVVRSDDEFVQFSPDELPPPPVAAATVSHSSTVTATETEPVSSSSTSDGATRLSVTAYIGIGNRLFIRGTGPGLNWDKGVPLQFVSIGKWRWETTDATAPIAYKLYKNDAQECLSLGEQSLAPAHHAEVTATF